MKPARQPTAYAPAADTVISVREAKAQFSALVARAAGGEEIILSWHGQPRARLVPLQTEDNVFRVDREWLHAMPVRARGKRSEAIVRADRDGRG